MTRHLLLTLSLLLAASCTVLGKSIKNKHVILIGVDGWGAYSVPKAHDIPNIQYMMDHGAWTLKKRSVLPSSSAINWASMFNGACTELHGYLNWGSRTPDLPSAYTNSHGIYPTIFSILSEQHPEAVTACMMEWDGIKYLVDSLAIGKVYVAADYEKNPDRLCNEAVAYLKEEKPTLAAICFDQLDHSGHSDGHDTPKYYETLARIDQMIGKLVQATKDGGYYDQTVFVLTADHGGKEYGHGGATLLEMETPFIICGKGIRQGYEITDVMMQFDVAATLAEALGLKRPQAWRGLPIYSAFAR